MPKTLAYCDHFTIGQSDAIGFDKIYHAFVDDGGFMDADKLRLGQGPLEAGEGPGRQHGLVVAPDLDVVAVGLEATHFV